MVDHGKSSAPPGWGEGPDSTTHLEDFKVDLDGLNFAWLGPELSLILSLVVGQRSTGLRTGSSDLRAAVLDTETGAQLSTGQESREDCWPRNLSGWSSAPIHQQSLDHLLRVVEDVELEGSGICQPSETRTPAVIQLQVQLQV